MSEALKQSKEHQQEKKFSEFSENLRSGATFSVPKINERLEKLKTAINKVFFLSPFEISLNENVRFGIDKNSDEYLALKASIEKDGILQPVCVELREKSDCEYELVAVSGHRRILCAQDLKLEKILCVIKKYEASSDSRLLHSLAENLLRSDLDPLEIAEGYSNLLKKGWSVDKISNYFGKQLNYVYCILKLASYSDEAKEIIRNNKDKFSMRVLINEFTKRKWASDLELLQALNKKITISRVQEIGKRLEKNNDILNSFYEKNQGINNETKEYIVKALNHFKIYF